MFRLLPRKMSKWGSYIDQFVVFPVKLRWLLRAFPSDGLFVFSDQALGPWVPIVQRFPHVVHCHDLLALRSALGQIPENRTKWTGRVYQRFIRAGFRRARHFISVSEKTRSDLHAYGQVAPVTSVVVYNGLNGAFEPLARDSAAETLVQAGFRPGPRGMILSVGSGVWYKNQAGLLAIYERYAKRTPDPLPLWIVGSNTTAVGARDLARQVAPGSVQFLVGLNHRGLQAAYSLSRVMLFPSLAEGFGWPIVEAMACGCPVLTTGEAPMTEVGGSAARYIPRLAHGDDIGQWAARGADELSTLLALAERERSALIQAGFVQAARFGADRAIEAYLDSYQRILELERGQRVKSDDGAPRRSVQTEGAG
jgi:glycosyltransferase involved in cell wall biosynthesis